MLRANAIRALRAARSGPYSYVDTAAPFVLRHAAIDSEEQTDIRSHWKFFVLEGILVLVLGLLAVTLPGISTVGIEQLIGWLFILGGFIGTATIIRKHHRPSSWWPLSSSIVAMAIGVFLIRSPTQGVITLTILIMVLFVIKGVVSILVALKSRPYLRSRIWTLVGGLITLMIAYLMWDGLPNSASWAISVYVGINMIYLGASIIFTALKARGIDPAIG